MSATAPIQLMPPGISTAYKGGIFRHLWTYRDENKNIIGYVARYDLPDGSKVTLPFFKRNGNAWAAGAIEPHPLFGRESILVFDTGPVYVAEGEKCVAALCGMGLSAVCSLGGAQAASKADWKPLRNMSGVIILPDNDEPGEQYAQAVAACLSKLDPSPEVVVCRLPELPPKGDICDWVKAQRPQWDEFGPVPDPEPLAALLKELSESNSVAIEAIQVPRVEPVPLLCDDKQAPFPVEALMPTLAGAHAFITEVLGVPSSMAGNTLLSAGGLAVQPHRDVRIDSVQCYPISLYALTIGSSGSRKTSCDKMALQPHREYERKCKQAYTEEMRKFHIAQAVYKAQSDRILKDGKLSQEAQNRRIEALTKPEEPQHYLLTVGEPTIEGLNRLFLEGRPSLGLFADEGALLLGGLAFNKDNVTRTFGVINKYWDGDPITQCRKGDGSLSIEGRRLAAHIMIQPCIAPALIGNPMAEGIGLLSRFLISWPEPMIPPEHVDKDPHKDMRMIKYYDAISRLLNMPFKTNSDPRHLAPQEMRLSPDALRAWRAFDSFVRESIKANTYADVDSTLRKAAQQAARIACVLQTIEDFSAQEISLPAMQNGIILTKWYLNEAQRLRSVSQNDEEAHMANRLLEWLRKQDGAVSTSYIHRNGPNGIRKQEIVVKALLMLKSHGYVDYDPNTKRVALLN